MQFPTKKPLKKESKLDQNLNVGSAPKRVIQHSWSVDWHKLKARPKDSWIEISPTFFDILEMRTHPNLYLIIQLIFWNIPTSINKGSLPTFNTLSNPPPPPLFLALLFWFFKPPYVKDVLEAFALGTSFL